MKIIKVDNFNRETISDVLIADNVQNSYASVITEFLNKKYGGNDLPDFFRAVEDDYKLYKFEP